jgi:tryptophan synthase beta chain
MFDNGPAGGADGPAAAGGVQAVGVVEGSGAGVAHRPDRLGHFGSWGGRFVPEVLMAALDQLTEAFEDAIADPAFNDELDALRRDYAGRPTPLFCARRLSEELGLRVWLKREDLLHTGAHKLNNSLGQHLLTRRMGKPRVIAETGAGQHGVATATVAALLGQECVVYMGEEDTRRQHLNVVRMRLLGTEVRPVATGTATLKDAINEALRDWVETVGSTHYAIGSVVGPHPYPLMVREFQRVIGDEARAQFLAAEGRLPDLAVACVGGGSNAAGLFAGFVDDEQVRLVGVEAGGRGPRPGDHGASLGLGEAGVLHGARSYILQDPDGQVLPTHSVSAGLDYPGVGPEHAFWKDAGRVAYERASDTLALDGFRLLARTEGLLPALEPAHAVGWLAEAAHTGQVAPGTLVVLNLSGRGDKDVETVAGLLADPDTPQRPSRQGGQSGTGREGEGA